MKLRMVVLLASTAFMPAVALAQTPQATPRPAATQAGAQVPAAADFVNRAAISNMFEIQSSQLAQQKAQNDRVRQFAQSMVRDHTAAGDKLKSSAQGIQGATIPSSLDQPHQQMVQTLQSASGPGFDRDYVQMQVTAHRDAVSLFDQYAQNGDNQQLKQFAQQTLPTLREHLQSVEQIQKALPPAQVGATPSGGGQQPQQTAQNQAGQDPSRIVVQQPAPTVRVDQASPQVTVQQAQPNVTVRQPQPEILVRQPQPTVTVDIPQPEIIVRMPQPDVNVAMAQPQVQVNQPQPQVQVVQPQQQPQVQVQPAQPQVQVQQTQGQPSVQVQGADNQPNVRYERAEPRVVVNQPQGQPNVRMEQQGEGPQANPQQQAAARPADTTAPQATGALPGAQGLTVSRVDDMNLYNTQGNELGDVERVVQGPDGKQYVVIGAGGFLGMGEKHVAIPVERVALRGDRLIIQGLTEDQIRALPSFDRNDRSFRQLEGNQPVQVSVVR
jgi:predicted outer membrane protein/sporulation protein YlmC with PRC-barrel domain